MKESIYIANFIKRSNAYLLDFGMTILFIFMCAFTLMGWLQKSYPYPWVISFNLSNSVSKSRSKYRQAYFQTETTTFKVTYTFSLVGNSA